MLYIEVLIHFSLLGADFLFTYVVALAYQNCVYKTERKQSLISGYDVLFEYSHFFCISLLYSFD